MTQNTMTQNTRTISAIARDIRADWKKVNYAAKPYLEAMLTLHSLETDFGHDSGENIVRYFLCNASTYRGEKAKTLKAELKTLCGMK
jgi:hypothetical protein